MIRGIFWLAVAYGFGAFAFSIAFIFDAGLGNDAVGAIVEGVAKGLLWPFTVYDLITGNITA